MKLSCQYHIRMKGQGKQAILCYRYFILTHSSQTKIEKNHTVLGTKADISQNLEIKTEKINFMIPSYLFKVFISQDSQRLQLKQ